MCAVIATKTKMATEAQVRDYVRAPYQGAVLQINRAFRVILVNSALHTIKVSKKIQW